jgi:hypothetical protein
MSNMNKEIQEFCYKYDAVAGPSNRMHRRVKRINYSEWLNEHLLDTIGYHDVPMVEIHMPEDRFRALIEHDDWLEDVRRIPGWHGSKVQMITEQHEQECLLRQQYPGLQDLYHKYQLMLNLVK